MEIVIKITEEDYKAIAKGYLPYGAIADAIRNGTPLPEHHGRIIDESKIHKCGWDYIKHHAKTDAPTIIEGSEEVKKNCKSNFEHCDSHKEYEEDVNMIYKALKREVNLKEDNAYRERKWGNK